MKIALLSNINMDLMVPRFEECLKDIGINGDLYVSGFNQYMQEMINPDSVLNKGDFDIAVIFLDGEEIFQNVIREPFAYKDKDIELIIDSEINNLSLQLGNVIRSNRKLTFFINNIFIRRPSILGALDYNTEFGPAVLQERFNSKIRHLRSSERVVIIDFAALVSRYGYETIYDNRLWYLGRIKFSSQGLLHISKLLSSYIQAYLGKSKKALILDLDNTLWGGIVGEDGIEGIKLGTEGIGRAYYDFQELIKALKHKGILISVCSKNNLADVKEVFEENEFMKLEERDFVAFKVNWESKTKNIREIAADLNLGLDSFVFVDDNPFEREMVRSELPQVVVPDFPKDPANLTQWMIDLSCQYFNNITITNEDKLRTEIYHASAERKELERSASTSEDFYKSLEMTAVMKINSQADFKRIAQLSQRTNQFNLTSRRYTENEVLDFMNSRDWMVFGLELTDRFGPNGIIGVINVRINGADARIDTFLLSCRVIGRTVEDFFVYHVIEELRERGVKKVFGEYIPTKKNSVVKDMYKKLKFKLLEESVDGSNLWELDLSETIIEKNTWIKRQLSIMQEVIVGTHP